MRACSTAAAIPSAFCGGGGGGGGAGAAVVIVVGAADAHAGAGVSTGAHAGGGVGAGGAVDDVSTAAAAVAAAAPFVDVISALVDAVIIVVSSSSSSSTIADLGPREPCISRATGSGDSAASSATPPWTWPHGNRTAGSLWGLAIIFNAHTRTYTLTSTQQLPLTLFTSRPLCRWHRDQCMQRWHHSHSLLEELFREIGDQAALARCVTLADSKVAHDERVCAHCFGCG